jgi:hypothetical protein
VNSEVEFCIDFCVLNPEHGTLGWKIEEEISSSRSFLMAASKSRSKLENMAWKKSKQIALPTYWDLCVMEYKAMMAPLAWQCGGSNWLLSIIAGPVLAVVIASGLGHIFTSVGLRAMYVVYWNYSRFFMFAAGIVTPDVAFVFDLHNNIHRYSCVWDDASVVASRRLKDIVSQPAEAQNDEKRFSSSSSSSPSLSSSASSSFSYKGSRESVLPTWFNSGSAKYDYHGDADKDRHAALKAYSDQYVRLEERKEVLKRHVLQDQLRSDYGVMLYASIATRATLLQLFPYISFLAPFAANTAANPFFVYDKYLESNLSEGIIRDPVAEWRQMAQQEIDLEYELRMKETREDSYVLPVPPEGESNAYGTREQVEAKNAISREIYKQVAAQGKPLVREWEARLQGVISYVNGSRYIQYGKGVFNFIMSTLLVYCGEKSSKLLVGIMMVGLSPFVFVQCLQVLISLGTTDNMCITDEELLNELGWLLRFLQAAYRYLSACVCFCLCFFSKKENANSQSEVTPGDAAQRNSDQSSPPDDPNSNSVEMQSVSATVAVDGLAVINPILTAELAGAAASSSPREGSPESSVVAAKQGTTIAANAPADTPELSKPAAVSSPIDRAHPVLASKLPRGNVPLPVDVVSSKALTTEEQDGHFPAMSRSRKMALEFEEIADRASMSGASTSRAQPPFGQVSANREGDAHSLSRSRVMALEFEEIAERASMSGTSTSNTQSALTKQREDAAHTLSRSKKMALEFEDIAEKAAISSVSTARKHELEALPHMEVPAERDGDAHVLSRSKKMALEFEEIAERAALGGAGAADLAKIETPAEVDVPPTAASRKDGDGDMDRDIEREGDRHRDRYSSHSKGLMHRVPTIKQDFTVAIESAKRKADAEYSL